MPAATGDAATNAASPSALPGMQHADLPVKLATYRMTGRWLHYASGHDRRCNVAASSTLSDNAIAARDATEAWDRHQSTTAKMAELDVGLAQGLPNARIGTRTMRTPCDCVHGTDAAAGAGSHAATEHVCEDQLEQLAEAYVQARTRGESEEGALRVFLRWIADVKQRHHQEHPGCGLVFVVGADCIGSRSWGARKGPLRLLLRLLTDQFLVIMLDEAYTSQLCPRCLGRTSFVRKRDLRSKKCDHCHGPGRDERGQPRPFVFDRDYAAAVNFVTILRYMCSHGGKRPRVFEKANRGSYSVPL